MNWVLYVVLAGLIAAAAVIRRQANNPESVFGRWVENRMRPRLAQGLRAFFYLTLVLWFVIYLTASKEERGSLSDFFENIVQTFDHGDKDLP